MSDGSKSEVDRMRDKSATIEEEMALTSVVLSTPAGDVCQEHVTTGEEEIRHRGPPPGPYP